MKIGYVLDDSLDKTDGVQQYVHTVGAWMAHQGHDIHYLTGGKKSRYHTQVHILGRNLKVRFNRNILSMPVWSSGRQIKELLAREKFDLLHIQMPYSPILAGKVIRHCPRSTAMVGTFHIYPYSNMVTLGTKLLAWVNIATTKKLQAVCSVSRAAQHFAEESAGIHTRYIPNAVELARFQQAKPYTQINQDFTIVFVGRLVERKGALQLLRAVHYLQSKYSENIKLVICGDGPQANTLARFVKDHALQNVVVMKGFVSETAKARYLASADLAVFPSLGGESFGIVLLEAMAAGAVVLGGDNPGYREVLGNNQVALVDPNDTPVFAARLHQLITKKALRQKLHDYQQASLSRYDIEKVGNQLLHMYREAIEKTTQPKDNK